MPYCPECGKPMKRSKRMAWRKPLYRYQKHGYFLATGKKV